LHDDGSLWRCGHSKVGVGIVAVLTGAVAPRFLTAEFESVVTTEEERQATEARALIEL